VLRVLRQNLFGKDPSFVGSSLTEIKVGEAHFEKEVIRVLLHLPPDLLFRLFISSAFLKNTDSVRYGGVRFFSVHLKALEVNDEEIVMKLRR
jgi:hypothetical protein